MQRSIENRINANWWYTIKYKQQLPIVAKMAMKNNKMYFADKCNNVNCFEFKCISRALGLTLHTEVLCNLATLVKLIENNRIDNAQPKMYKEASGISAE